MHVTERTLAEFGIVKDGTKAFLAVERSAAGRRRFFIGRKRNVIDPEDVIFQGIGTRRGLRMYRIGIDDHEVAAPQRKRLPVDEKFALSFKHV